MSKVGPVLQPGAMSDAIARAIRAENADTELIDRGGYLRVQVPKKCVLLRTRLEAELGHPIRLARELESVMSAFKGRIQLDEDRAVWEDYD